MKPTAAFYFYIRIIDVLSWSRISRTTPINLFFLIFYAIQGRGSKFNFIVINVEESRWLPLIQRVKEPLRVSNSLTERQMCSMSKVNQRGALKKNMTVEKKISDVQQRSHDDSRVTLICRVVTSDLQLLRWWEVPPGESSNQRPAGQLGSLQVIHGDIRSSVSLQLLR